MKKIPSLSCLLSCAVTLVAVPGARLEAHNLITTRYDFHRDVLRILHRYCTACHRRGGAAPMSLETYQDVRPRAVAIKEQILLRKMPPWYAEPESVPLEGASSLTARELDILADWTSGGAPEPAPESPQPLKPGAVPQVEHAPQVEDGPDVDLSLGGVALRGEQKRLVVERSVSLDKGDRADRFLRAWDVVPSAPAVLRGAVLELAGGPAPRYVAGWVANQGRRGYPEGTGFRLPPQARLDVRLYYVRPWTLGREAAEDTPRLRLWFSAERPEREIRSTPVDFGKLRIPPQALLVGVVPRVPLRLVEGAMDGKGRALLDVFHAEESWPLAYFLRRPLAVGRGGLRLEPPASPASSTDPATVLFCLPLGAR